MASPPWFSEETLRRPSIVTVVVVVKTTVEEGVCVESPLLSILHGPAGLLSDFAPSHSWLLPWGGQIHVKRSHRIPAPHLLCDTLLCPLAEAEAVLQAAPRVPSGSKWRTQRTKVICKFLQRKSTAWKQLTPLRDSPYLTRAQAMSVLLTLVTPEPKTVSDTYVRSQCTYDEQINKL